MSSEYLKLGPIEFLIQVEAVDVFRRLAPLVLVQQSPLGVVVVDGVVPQLTEFLEEFHFSLVLC